MKNLIKKASLIYLFGLLGFGNANARTINTIADNEFQGYSGSLSDQGTCGTTIQS